MNICKFIPAAIIASGSLCANDELAYKGCYYKRAPVEQECPKPDPCDPSPTIEAYNAPFHHDLSDCAYNVWADVSFIYWQPTEDNLEFGMAVDKLTGTSGDHLALSGRIVNMDFDFMPGFKIGTGITFKRDNWDLYAEYTWLHGEDHKSSNGGALGLEPMYPDVNSIANYVGSGPIFYGTGKAKWKIKLDFVDLDLGRNYYVGKYLTLHPYFGLRGAWIRQSLEALHQLVLAPNFLNSKDGTVSWGLGPKLGLDANWDLSSGWRIISNGSADLLYTHYSAIYRSSIFNPKTVPALLPQKISEHDMDTVRAHMDIELGFGWGTYLYCKNLYLDLGATYDFQVFFGQNMFRKFFVGGGVPSSLLYAGNLYIQGLNIKAKLDF